MTRCRDHAIQSRPTRPGAQEKCAQTRALFVGTKRFDVSLSAVNWGWNKPPGLSDKYTGAGGQPCTHCIDQGIPSQCIKSRPRGARDSEMEERLAYLEQMFQQARGFPQSTPARCPLPLPPDPEGSVTHDSPEHFSVYTGETVILHSILLSQP